MKALQFRPQSWMTAPETVAVIDHLRAGGAQARFVGGCVRDLLIGRPVNDVDIATDAEPLRVIDIMKKAGFKTIPIGLSHGAVMVVVEGVSFEITTLRRDVETDGRHAKVAFTMNWDEDAARRDFTFNALSLDVEGTIHDPFAGADDLKQGRVRFVGDAATRIDEDVLRLLRYYRFFAYFGRLPADANARAACRDRASDIKRLSAERVRAELLKLLAAPDPTVALEMMREDGVLRHVIGVDGNIDFVTRVTMVEAVVEAMVETPGGTPMGEIDPMRRLFALLSTDAKGVRAAAQRLKLSNMDRKFLIELCGGAGRIQRDMTEFEIQREVYHSGAALSRDRALLAWAQDNRTADEEKWRVVLRLIENAPCHVLPVTGADVLERGIAPGAVVGKLLRMVEKWWIDNNFKMNRAACLRHLEQAAQLETDSARRIDPPRDA